jgi:hypothetical protein
VLSLRFVMTTAGGHHCEPAASGTVLGMIDRLANVAVRTRGHHIATLALCESCFAAHYLPLASSTDAERGELLISPVPSSAR